MKITHIALWTVDIDRLAAFWQCHFGAEVGPLYHSPNRIGFRSRWLSLPSGPKIELMTGPWIAPTPPGERAGYAHLALSLGSPEAVDRLARALDAAGIQIGGPRRTGDGFYEATLQDPDGNVIEITV